MKKAEKGGKCLESEVSIRLAVCRLVPTYVRWFVPGGIIPVQIEHIAAMKCCYATCPSNIKTGSLGETKLFKFVGEISGGITTTSNFNGDEVGLPTIGVAFTD